MVITGLFISWISRAHLEEWSIGVMEYWSGGVKGKPKILEFLFSK